MHRVAVIGGGPAGCSAAFLLRGAGLDVVLLEAAGHVGGRTHTFRAKGIALDSGAGFFTSFYPHVERYVRDLGLAHDRTPVPSGTTFSCAGRRAVLDRADPWSFWAYPFLSARGKTRFLAYGAGLTLKRGRFDPFDPQVLSKHDDRSAAEAAREALGEDVYQYLVRPSIESFWFFSCEEISQALMLALYARAAGSRFYTLAGGMDQICTRLVKGIDVRTGCRASAIHARSEDEIAIEWEHGDMPHAETFDGAVVATTASQADWLTRKLPPSMVTAVQRMFLGSQRYVANVHCAYLAEGELPRGVTFSCGPGELPVNAVGTRPAGSGTLVQVFLGRGPSEELAGSPLDEVSAEAWRLGRSFHPELPESARTFATFKRAEAIPVHEVGRYKLAARFATEQRPPVVFAGDYLATAAVEGAVRSGAWASRVLLDR
ncbi:MAG: FAD-dependent oxidoreductase [Deltaproteobacteria bacterium]|nr:FAD-dependent oxidoreductase [Deltaproteobacteria bacterium]